MKQVSLMVILAASLSSLIAQDGANQAVLADLRSAIQSHAFDKAAAAYTQARDAGITDEQLKAAGIFIKESNDGEGGICFKISGPTAK